MLSLCASLAGADAPKPPAKEFIPTASYKQQTLEGFTVLVSPQLIEHEQIARDSLALLEKKLAEIKTLLSPEQLKPLQETKFWIEWEQLKNGGACAHHSIDWLKSNGYNPEKVHSIEISNARNFLSWSKEQPMMILHELAHIYHHNVLKPDNRDIKDAYKHAVKSGIYDSVEYVLGGKKKAYALNNDLEYFSEITEAYFGRNDFQPFTHDELKEFDPVGFALLEKIWGPREVKPPEAQKAR